MVARLRPRLVGMAGVLALVVSVGACSASDDDDGAAVREAPRSAAAEAGSGSASAPHPPPRPESDTTGGARPPAHEELNPMDCLSVQSSAATPMAAIEVEASLFTMRAVPAQVPAGTVQIVGVNKGRRPHSVAIARYDGDPASLPLDENGAVDVTRLPDGAIVGEISEFAVGGACSAAFDLQPGPHIAFCYIVEEDEAVHDHRTHYAKGMYTTFVVT